MLGDRLRRRSRPCANLDRSRRHQPPLGPGSIVDTNAAPTQQFGKYEPGDTRSIADRAVGDKLVEVVEAIGKHAVKYINGRIRSIAIHDCVERDVERAGNVPGSARTLRSTGRPETLAA